MSPLLSLAALAAPPISAPSHARRSRPREPASVYGQIREVLSACPDRAWRACDVRRRLAARGLRLSHEVLGQRLHKMARRRQVQRVTLPGEWFSRWQVLR